MAHNNATLAQAVELSRDPAGDFEILIDAFLDAFYTENVPDLRQAMIDPEPPV